MDVKQAQALAQRLLEEQGLTGWQFKFDRARRRFGCCWGKRKLITLSKPLTELNDLEQVRDTLLHEIAHALVPGGHTPAWRRMCVKIGATPRRCFNSNAVNLPQINRTHRYVAVCPCPIQHIRKKKPQGTYICRKCKTRLNWARQSLVAVK